MKKLIYIFVSVISLTSCSSHFAISSNEQNEIITSTKEHDYNEVSDKKITWNCIFFEAKVPYFVYCYSLTCSHCASLKNAIIEYAINNDNLYFCEDSKDTILKGEVDNTIGVSSSSELAIKGFPSLIKIEEGKVVLNLYGETKISNELHL